ncbi:asparagine synthase-related protein [Gleimia sp. 6138-11-ORH1]|uniref:asparagine synthase-related protein n=1 Tax=Gleimia sp. 6138-11-ORH1 TaxID=2973937 RepID=UPI00216A036A|nr:asparagine synthase-related protein [Gleimia sp. 6138-11-ORH1]MCS4484029.1 asparagine synthase-related protein [Gleimia sp. 6138-11-ORH1]
MIQVLDSTNWIILEHQLGRIYWHGTISGQLPNQIDTDDPIQWASAQQGNWGAVILQEDKALLLCDQARSIPLLYLETENGYDIVSDVNALIAHHRELTLYPEAAAEFRHFGYVLGTDTLLKGVHSVPFGAMVRLRVGKAPKRVPLISTIRAKPGTELAKIEALSTEEFLELFYAELKKAFQFTLAQAKGRQLLIPLSGGADSRLLLAILKELNAPNVLCFTYGQPGSPEAHISESVAKGLGFEWILVELKPTEMKEKWQEAEDFLKATWTGQALPHIQDWYALTQLQNHPQVEAGAIVLPGHTIVGNEHDEWCAEPELHFTKRDAVKVFIDHHGILQGKPKEAASFYTVYKLSHLLRDFWTGKAPENRLETIVALNISERQSKYISNSVRAYEYFGFDWALPMYERSVWDVWINAPQQFHESVRVEYVRYANELYSRISKVELDYFKGAVQSLPSGAVRVVKTALEKTHLLNLANHTLSVRTQLNHPMGFHALAGEIPKAKLALKLAGGATLFGVYADLFLTDQWVPGSHVMPPY